MAYTTIDDPSAHFQIALYTGQGGTATAVTNDGNSDLQPDLIFFKSRTTTARWNCLDSTRGTTKVLYPDGNDAEATDGGDAKPLDSFNSDGFTAGESLDHHTNISSASMIAFQWKANGGTTSSNTSGDITSTVQADTTAGCSIVTYTGNNTDPATFGHGLGAVPHFITIKKRGNTGNWMTYHQGMGADKAMFLDLDNAIESSSFYQETPTSTLVTLNDHGNVNGNSETYVCYCFTSIQGYSKFGSYKGNYNADGPFIYTGFKPAFEMVKEVDNANDWDLRDSARNPHNHVDTWLRPNTTDQDGDSDAWDFLSNGFKIRQASNRTNRSDGTLIYAAFAEQPFVSSEGVPCTAR